MDGDADCRVGALPLLAMTVKGCQAENCGHSEGVSPWESVSFLASPSRRGGSADPGEGPLFFFIYSPFFIL